MGKWIVFSVNSNIEKAITWWVVQDEKDGVIILDDIDLEYIAQGIANKHNSTIEELEARIELLVETEMSASRELARYHAGTDDYSQIKAERDNLANYAIQLSGIGHFMTDDKLKQGITALNKIKSTSEDVVKSNEYWTKKRKELESERDEYKRLYEASLLAGSDETTAPEAKQIPDRGYVYSWYSCCQSDYCDCEKQGGDNACEYCNGLGYHICDECIGQGNKPDFSGAPNNPSVCEDCGGTGKQDCIICNAENGE